jgi:hypothetical protein
VTVSTPGTAVEKVDFVAVYEITVLGVAGPAIKAALAEFVLRVKGDSTVITAELPDSAAFYGLLDRVRDVGLEVIEVRHFDSRPLG